MAAIVPTIVASSAIISNMAILLDLNPWFETKVAMPFPTRNCRGRKSSAGGKNIAGRNQHRLSNVIHRQPEPSLAAQRNVGYRHRNGKTTVSHTKDAQSYHIPFGPTRHVYVETARPRAVPPHFIAPRPGETPSIAGPPCPKRAPCVLPRRSLQRLGVAVTRGHHKGVRQRSLLFARVSFCLPSVRERRQ